MDMTATLQKTNTLLIQYGMNFLAAIVIFIVGKWCARLASRFVSEAMKRTHVNETLGSFTRHMTFYAFMAFVAIAALNKLGVETSSFIAVIGAASLAVGLALQGSLANFASGVLLILFQPFHVGDEVEAGGAAGRVTEIQIFNTIIVSKEGNKVIVPNAKITGDKITVFVAKA